MTYDSYMPTRKRNLPTNFEPCPYRVKDAVIDSIMVKPRSLGFLYLPGDYSVDNRPHGHVKVYAAGSDGYEVEQVNLGDSSRYVVTHRIWNYRDSEIFADLMYTS